MIGADQLTKTEDIQVLVNVKPVGASVTIETINQNTLTVLNYL